MPPLETELTTHAGALRALARVLVGEHHADDLVQETVLQVVAAPPARPTGLRGWLVAVMRHRAGKHHRGERRRQLRERAMPEAEPMASPARIVEHADTLRRLTAALTGLPEPYLGTLMLRFFEDLPPTAIAERTGVPVTTVKSRLQRGLAMLRQRLAAADEDWRASLGALFGGIALPVAATTTTGVLLMSSATKLVLGGATLVAALLIWASIDPGSGSPDPGRAAPADPRLSTAAIDAPTATDPADEVADVTATRTTPDAPSPEVVIHGRCVDESGLPLGGCAVTLRGHRVEGVGKDFAREYAEWLRARGSNDWQDQRFVTGGDGTFEFAVAPSPLSLQLSLSRDRLEFLSSIGQMLRPATRDLGDLLVPATCAVDIRVIDSRGLPVATPVLSVDRSPGADATATGAGPFARPLPPE
ncbi:MAG: sigma-70 family RNA polymerase sigma factor, partial [Planctomycetes bacterium]|nr:sigma-70 family RNA polymerase sigma factor [Planctomycetota bacterium]